MFAFHRAIAVLGVVFAASGAVHGQDLTGEVWSVCGNDGVLTWHDTRLVFTGQVEGTDGITLEGHFDWRSSGGHAGREPFTGILGADGSLALQGLEMLGSESLVTSRYIARVSEDGTAIVEGVRLDGAPGIWAAARDGGAGTAEALCDLEAQLS